MRASLRSLELNLEFFDVEEAVPDDVRHLKTLEKSLELLAALGTLLRAFPMEIQGNEIWTKGYATHRAEEIGSALRGVGTLTTGLADSAFGSLMALRETWETGDKDQA